MSKVQLKIWMGNGIKKMRDPPKTMQALNTLIDANIKERANERCIWYQDETKDWITIADDEDLQVAYDTAKSDLDSQLKIFVKPALKKEDQTTAKVQEQLTTKVGEKPAEKKNILLFKEVLPIAMTTDKSHNLNKQQALPQVTIAMAHTSFKQNQIKEKDSDSSDGEGFELMKSMIKKNIKQSMMESFTDFELVDKSQFGQKNIDSSSRNLAPNPLMESMYPNEVHKGVRCDGCGIFPITGPRYKCTVNKDFDFCANCEESKDHPYAFLKIKRAGDAPSFIKTTLDDSRGKPNMVMNDYFVPNNHDNMVQISLKCKQLEQDNTKLKGLLKAEAEMAAQLRKDSLRKKHKKIKAVQLYI